MVLAIALVIILVLLVLGLPLAYVFFLASCFILVAEGLPLDLIASVPFFSIDSFPLMAIPFFILAGVLMQVGGISELIFKFINSIVGRVRGGLGAVAVLASMFFGALTGSSVATVSAIGSLMIPEMTRKGYPKQYATALICASGFLGILIPPSIPGIIYGVTAEVSIAKVFLATVGPGIILGAMYILMNYLIMGRKLPIAEESFSAGRFASNVLTATRRGFFALMMPVVILGGIYGGFFTPTEAAAVAVVYGLFVGIFIYRTLNLKTTFDAFRTSAAMSAVLLIIIALAGGVMGRVFTILQVPAGTAAWLIEVTKSPVVVLLLINIFLLLMGMFLETNTIVLITTPVFIPVINQYGIDPIHFGAIILLNVEIGLITPPFAGNLFVGCRVADLTIDKVWHPLVPFLLICFPVLLLVTLVPQVSLLIPNLLMGG